MEYDFGGWATRANVLCSDGRTIMPNAFKENDGETVPLVWNHQHNDPLNVLGHALLKDKDGDVYAYCTFNDTEAGRSAKELVKHKDVSSLSIYANNLKQEGGHVTHGVIREVSLVLAGANPTAFIDNIIAHGEEQEDQAIIYPGDDHIILHADDPTVKNQNGDNMEKDPKEQTPPEGQDQKQEPKDKDSNKTVQDVIDSMTEEQRNVMYGIIGAMLEDDSEDADQKESEESKENQEKEDDTEMKHNVFDQTVDNDAVLTHAEMQDIFTDAKRYGSLKESVLQHGITNIDYAKPEPKFVGDVPGMLSRDQAWVADVMAGVHKTPFSRLKSIYANLTEDDARAKGYIKGKLKKEEVFALLKRTTTPTTIYKKQKIDRDDLLDITDFDVVAFLKQEMNIMMHEEKARAYLVGDGRNNSSDDKISETNIRPIWKDEDLYTIKKAIEVKTSDTEDTIAKEFIRTAVKARKEYKGSGNPTLYVTEDMLTNMLLMEDQMGRVIYDSVDKLATALRVSKIVSVPVMENQTREDSGDSKIHTLQGIIVNLNDYYTGTDRGGEDTMFDDFDIDYNAQKYLLESRCSGSLMVPYSAIAIETVPEA